MGGLHHVMLTVEDEDDFGQIKEPPTAYCRLDVVGGVAMLTLTPLLQNGALGEPKLQFSVSARSLLYGLQALVQDEADGEPEEWAQRTVRANRAVE